MQVVIKNEEGQFLSRTLGEISFVERKERAFVYDLEEDRVEEQIQIVARKFGKIWSWEKLGDTKAVDALPKNKWDGRLP